MIIGHLSRTILCCAVLFSTAAVAQEGAHTRTLPPNPLPYDLLLKGGHVLDDKNHIDAMRDVGIKDGKIAAVAEHLDPKDALKTIDVNGLYVTPGLIDLHTHVYTGTGERGSYAGDLSVYPDGSPCVTALRPSSTPEALVGETSMTSRTRSSIVPEPVCSPSST